MLRILAALLLVLLILPASAAADVVDDAGAALRSDPVFEAPGVDPAADLDDGELSALRERIERSGKPVFVAILPASAGNPSQAAEGVARATGRDGTYGVITGRSFRGGPSPAARAEASAALQSQRDSGAAAILADFVDRSIEPGVQGPQRNRGGGGFPWFLILLLGGVGLLAFRGVSKSRRRRADDQAQFAEVKATAEQDIAAIADDVTALDDDVEAAGAPPAAKEAYLRALDHYERADRKLRQAGTVAELRAVAEEAADGRYEMASAHALLEGREPLERRAPCFFDPRHGPSVQDVEYAPPGGQERDVPVCAACATRLADGQEPDVRSEVVNGREQPYWAGGYYGGAFGGFGPGLLGGLLLGSMFSAGTGDAWASGGDFGGGGGGGDWGFGGGGDLGGGFGGGDFGGGGGDF